MLIIALLAALCLPAVATAKIELDYSKPWCAAHGGQAEVVEANGTRPDCTTRYYAIEMDFAPKWYESVGQALYYADETGKQPGIVLIVGPGDDKYVRRLHRVIRDDHLPIQVWTIPQ
jgi:hypothetical protein